MLKRSCRFYNTTGKCHFGKHCKFLHELDISQVQESEKIESHGAVNQSCTEEFPESVLALSNLSSINKDGSLISAVPETAGSSGILESSSQERKQIENESLKESSKASGRNVCRFFAKNRFCHFGGRCRFAHVLQTKKHAAGQDDLLRGTNNLSLSDESKQNEPEKNKVQDEAGLLADSVIDVKGSVVPQPKEPKKKLCKFFKQGYCRFGKKCHFYHPQIQGKSVEAEAKTADENVHVTHSSVTPADNNDGFQPVVRSRPKVIHVYERKDLNKEKQKELRGTELQQLKRRFPAEKIKVLEETEEQAVYVFTFQPSDPDWPFDVKFFDIQVAFGTEYPLQLFKVELPMDQDLPATVRRYVEVSLQEWVAKKEADNLSKGQAELLFRPFLRWMDRNLETIVTEGLRQLRRELTARAAGLQFIAASDLKKEFGNQACADTGDQVTLEDCQEDDKDTRRPVAYRKSDYVEEQYEAPQRYSSDENTEDDDDGKDSENTEDTVHQRPAVAETTERRGTELVFRNMQIWYCTTIMVEKLRLTVQCERCKTRTDFTTPPNRVNLVPCSKCNNRQLVVFRPVLAHSYSSTFGYLDLEGCVGFDVILQDCHFSMGCIMCSRDILVKKFSPGRVLDIFCRSCHNKMQFAADSVKLHTLTSGEVNPAKFSGNIHQVAVRRMGRVQKDPAIQEGKPLPDNGACKHYKKSFRWLRFPCCGKCYPCDLCHDDKEDHEMKFATRMVCGFCCKEQPFAAEKPCTGCSSALTKVHTTHWEGGKGCRNKITMSRSDEKKYTNMNKTVSNKTKAIQEKKQGAKNTKLRHS